MYWPQKYLDVVFLTELVQIFGLSGSVHTAIHSDPWYILLIQSDYYPRKNKFGQISALSMDAKQTNQSRNTVHSENTTDLVVGPCPVCCCWSRPMSKPILGARQMSSGETSLTRNWDRDDVGEDPAGLEWKDLLLETPSKDFMVSSAIWGWSHKSLIAVIIWRKFFFSVDSVWLFFLSAAETVWHRIMSYSSWVFRWRVVYTFSWITLGRLVRCFDLVRQRTKWRVRTFSPSVEPFSSCITNNSGQEL